MEDSKQPVQLQKISWKKICKFLRILIDMGRTWSLPCRSYFDNEVEIDYDHCIVYKESEWLCLITNRIESKCKEFKENEYYKYSDFTALINEYLLSDYYIQY